MIIVKVINQRVVQVALTGAKPANPINNIILGNRRQKQLQLFARHLVQSAAQSQKVTNANNQQLIPIARNIYFRQCQRADYKGNLTKQNAKVSYSMSATSGTGAQFLTADINPFIVIDREELDSIPDSKQIRRQVEKNEYYNQSFNPALAATTSGRKLVVLLSWLEAKERHIEKYRQFYLERGFDVLNVKTSPWDLLLPNVGAKKISEDFIRFMIDKQYSNVLLHGFSVGGYMFGRLLLEIDKQDPEARQHLYDSFKGIVFDSIVPFEGTCYGVANSITSNPIGAKVLENILKLYLYLGHNIATKYYLEVSDRVWGNPLRVPSLFLMSRDDKISDIKIVERLAKVWSELGVDTRKMVVDHSPHVQLFSNHHDRYVDSVENFLRHIKME